MKREELTTVPEGTLVFDLETDGLLDEVTKIHCLHVRDFHTGYEMDWHPGKETNTLSSMLERLSEAPCLIGHNILKYDLRVLKKLYPGFTYRRAIDTILCTRLLWPEVKRQDVGFKRTHPDFPSKLIGAHSLKAWGWRLGEHKGDYEGGWESWSQEMDDYCKQDVRVTCKIMERVLMQRPAMRALALEHSFQESVIRLEDAGFYFDTVAAKKLMLTLQARKDTLTETLVGLYPKVSETFGKTPEYYYLPNTVVNRWATKKEYASWCKMVGEKPTPKLLLAGPCKHEVVALNPASRHHRAAVLQAQGWKPTDFTDDGVAKVDEDSLAPLVGKYPGIEEMIEYLMVDKRLGQVSEGKNGWLRLVGKDNRIHGTIITNGCVTGRGAHIKPNLAQVPGVKDRVGNVQPYGRECRELFTVPRGYELVGADASGLELRCLAHYCFPFDRGEYAELVCSGDVHTANMEAAGLPSRPMAKTFIYAYLYGAGNAKLGSIVGGGVREGKAMRLAFQNKFKGLAALQAKLAEAVSSRGFLYGIDGRRLHVRAAYSALNTLLQSAGGLVMKHAFVVLNDTLDAAGWRWGVDADWCSVAHVHDEFQSQVIKGRGHDFGQIAVASIAKAGQDYNFAVPLAGEFRVGNSWADCH